MPFHLAGGRATLHAQLAASSTTWTQITGNSLKSTACLYSSLVIMNGTHTCSGHYSWLNNIFNLCSISQETVVRICRSYKVLSYLKKQRVENMLRRITGEISGALSGFSFKWLNMLPCNSSGFLGQVQLQIPNSPNGAFSDSTIFFEGTSQPAP